MKKLSRTFAAVLISFAFSFCAISFAPHPLPRFTISEANQTVPSFFVSPQGCSPLGPPPFFGYFDNQPFEPFQGNPKRV
jgi:hypothetical protein